MGGAGTRNLPITTGSQKSIQVSRDRRALNSHRPIAAEHHQCDPASLGPPAYENPHCSKELKCMPQLWPLFVYREHQKGKSVTDLAVALKMPEFAVMERLEAMKLCLERQVRIETDPTD